MIEIAKLEAIYSALEAERTSFTAQWREIGDHILPTRPRFTVTDANKGDRKNQKIIDNTPVLAIRTLKSGMHGGLTNPARPWFRLTVADQEMAEMPNIKNWLQTVTNRMVTMLLRSNIYKCLPQVYEALGGFGTAAMFVGEDFEDETIRGYVFPVGSYVLGLDAKGRVRVFGRRYQMTVLQIVEKYGMDEGRSKKIDWSRISPQVKALYQNQELTARIEICHMIMPNSAFQKDGFFAWQKRYVSYTYERGSCNGKPYGNNERSAAGYLEETGYDIFPVLAPRWATGDGDVYATSCPGMDAVGDCKQLQLGERKKMQAIEKKVTPPMKASAQNSGVKPNHVPGETTHVAERDVAGGVVPMYLINFDITELEGTQNQCRERINNAFYVPLFLMISNDERNQRATAMEIGVKQEEKLLALGPVLESVNGDLLDQLIDILFEVGMRQGQFPEAPEELQGSMLKVEYISIMAQAQKLQGVGVVERLLGIIGQVAQFKPRILDKLDEDQVADILAEMLSAPMGMIRDDQQVEESRAQQAQEQAAAAAPVQAAEMAKTAKDLAETPLDTDSALNAMIAQSEAGAIA